MMRIVRGTIGTWLAVTLLTLAIGLQVVEATGHWDRSFQDTADEAVIVTLVLCVGAALVVAARTRPRITLSVIHAAVVLRLATAFECLWSAGAAFASNTSPPLGLRV
jgi:hypothetical protein